MKSKDLPAIIIFAVATAALTFMATSFIFTKIRPRPTKVEVIDPISEVFNYEDKPYLKPGALNPTAEITVNENTSNSPITQ